MKRKMFFTAIALLISAGIMAQDATQTQAREREKVKTENKTQQRDREQKTDQERAQGQNYDQSQYKNYGQQNRAQKQARNEARKAQKRAQKEAKMQNKAIEGQGTMTRERAMEQEKAGAGKQNKGGARPSGPAKTGTGTPQGSRGPGAGGKR